MQLYFTPRKTLFQWRNQGLQNGGDKLSAEGENTWGGGGSGGMLPRENFEIQSLWNAFRALWREILQNSEDYNIIIRSRMPASSVIRLRIISWTWNRISVTPPPSFSTDLNISRRWFWRRVGRGLVPLSPPVARPLLYFSNKNFMQAGYQIACNFQDQLQSIYITGK